MSTKYVSHVGHVVQIRQSTQKQASTPKAVPAHLAVAIGKGLSGKSVIPPQHAEQDANQRVPAPHSRKHLAKADEGPANVTTNARVAESKKRAEWTMEAAARVGSAAARNGDGQVKKGSFAAKAMSKAMKAENKLKGGK